MSDSGSAENPDPWILRYPYAVRILCAALDVDLSLERVVDPELDPKELALVRIRVGGEQHDVIVDNEYGDADLGHRALLLVLVLMMLRFAEEAPTFEEWVREHWVENPSEHLRELHAQLAPAAKALLPVFRRIDLPGDYEWSVNSDGAQALRKLAAGEMW